jgi:hypothetical protein
VYNLTQVRVYNLHTYGLVPRHVYNCDIAAAGMVLNTYDEHLLEPNLVRSEHRAEMSDKFHCSLGSTGSELSHLLWCVAPHGCVWLDASTCRQL